MLTRRREILAQGPEPIGWKIGFNVPAIQEKLGIDRPLAGFLTTDGVLEDGASWSLGDEGDVVVESEVAVELGDGARSIVALLPALELADPPDLSLDIETILAGNIFHRAVAFGPRVERAPRAPLASSSTARSNTRSPPPRRGRGSRRWSAWWPGASRTRASSSNPDSGSSPACWRRLTRPSPATSCASRSRASAAWS